MDQRDSRSPSPHEPRPDEYWYSLAEERIREAMQQGAFDNLPGFGKPIPGIDEPWDENWWVREKLRRERVQALPPLLAARLEIEQTRRAILQIESEAIVRHKLQQLNERIRAAHFSPVPSPPVTVRPVDIEAELARWRAARAERRTDDASG
ncbi:MAG: DUF1992 domain-containing protein [Planctomycetota bacterium]|nr:MAG: DUF1992 domain-containing protein [Planctomycetota bacterium]